MGGDYEFKMPSRCDLMSNVGLSYTKDKVRVRTAFGVRSERKQSTNLYAGDIDRAQPKVYAPKVVTRENHAYDNNDIVGSKPRNMHVGLNRGYTSMNTDDIPGSKPDLNKFKTGREACNPLNPTYKLQSVEFIPPPIPRFIRDNIDHRDIDGAKPKKMKAYAMRDGHNVNDIVGARPKKESSRKTVHD